MNWKKIVALILALGLIALGWYFFYFTKTPSYSLKLIQEAVKTHNVEDFKKHVDVNSILNSGYDDVVKSELDKNVNDPLGRTFALAMAQSFKPVVVETLQTAILDKIAGTENKEPGKYDRDIKKFEEKYSLNSVEYKDIGSIEIKDGIANVPLVLYSPKLQEDFTVHILMKKLDDGTWQAYKVDNIAQFIDQIDKSSKKTNK